MLSLSKNEIKNTKKCIQHLRSKLQNATKKRKLTDPIVLHISQMLDKQINKYEKLIMTNAQLR